MNIQDGYITCEVSIDDNSVDSEKLSQWLLDLKREVDATNLITLLPAKIEISPTGTKGVDPVLAAIGFSMLSNSLPQILTFLHDWALRRENRVLKVKIQSKKDKFIEMEIPTGLSKKEVKDWIESIQSAIK